MAHLVGEVMRVSSSIKSAIGSAGVFGMAAWIAAGADVGLLQRQVDWKPIADAIVVRGLALAPGERVALFWDHSADRGNAAAVRAAIAAAGGVAIEANVPSMPELELSNRLDPAVRARQLVQRDSLWADAFRNVDAMIWLASPLGSMPGRPIEHLTERIRVRTLHFHWPLPSDPADAAWVEERYARAVAVEPASLESKMASLADTIRGATVRITSPNGTDFTFTVAPDAWFHHNTGDASPAKIAHARTIRDREEELPAGAFRTTSVSGGNGVLVGYANYSTQSPVIQATFLNGRITRFESRERAEANVADWNRATGDKSLQGDFIIGTNPELPAVSPAGFIPYYGYGAGVVRVVVGDNWEAGGKNRSSNGETPFVLIDASVTANGRTVVERGKLLEPGR
jgi:hypothetical protein